MHKPGHTDDEKGAGEGRGGAGEEEEIGEQGRREGRFGAASGSTFPSDTPPTRDTLTFTLHITKLFA